MPAAAHRPNTKAAAANTAASTLSTSLVAICKAGGLDLAADKIGETEVTAICDRVAILHEGSLRHDGPVRADDHAALERTFFEIAMNGVTAPARAA